jgi:hypothetical protein
MQLTDEISSEEETDEASSLQLPLSYQTYVDVNHIHSRGVFAEHQSLVASGVKMKRFVQKQGDLLYIPQGYLIIESTMPGQGLVYGARKSLMMKGDAHASAYRATTELFRASQRNCERMDLIFEMMKE